MASMTKREGVRAAVVGQDVDRLPLAFWHHFRPHGSSQKLAAATLDFFGRFDLDIFKIMPDIPYPFPRDAVRDADDWLLLSPLEMTEGNPGRMVRAAELAREALPNDEPLIVTMFSPLCYAMNFAGRDHIRQHLEEHPTRVHEALGSIETAEYPDHQVIEEIRKGYKLRDKLLRPALVKIAVNGKQVSE